MKGTVVILGTTLLAGLIASTETPTPTSSPKPNAAPAVERGSRLDSLANESELSGILLIAKNGVTISRRAIDVADKRNKPHVDLDSRFTFDSISSDSRIPMPIVKGIRERVPAN